MYYPLMKKPAVAIVRGKFLNRFEMQGYEPLTAYYQLTAFGSLAPLHGQFSFTVVTLPSPMDLPDFPYKMPVLNRLLTDAHYLFGLERRLQGSDIAHAAETYYRYTQQCLDAKKRGWVRRVIATVWETIPHNNEGIRGRKEYKARAREELDHIIAVTQKAKVALVTEGADPEKISVIGAHINTQRFAPEKAWLARLGDPKKRAFTVLFCGRLVSEKGVTDVLGAAALLSRDPWLADYRVDWVFIGEGSLQQAIIAKIPEIRKNWHLTLKSATYDQMPRRYREADLFVAPSKPRLHRGKPTWEEQFGMALVEAQASGLPIVTTTSGGIPENVKDAAVLVAPSDVAALAHGIKEFLLLPNKRVDFASRARKRAVATHDIQVGSKKLRAVYEQVLRM